MRTGRGVQGPPSNGGTANATDGLGHIKIHCDDGGGLSQCLDLTGRPWRVARHALSLVSNGDKLRKGSGERVESLNDAGKLFQRHGVGRSFDDDRAVDARHDAVLENTIL